MIYVDSVRGFSVSCRQQPLRLQVLRRPEGVANRQVEFVFVQVFVQAAQVHYLRLPTLLNTWSFLHRGLLVPLRRCHRLLAPSLRADASIFIFKALLPLPNKLHNGGQTQFEDTEHDHEQKLYDRQCKQAFPISSHAATLFTVCCFEARRVTVNQ